MKPPPSRHRFGKKDTAVMPLAEVLRHTDASAVDINNEATGFELAKTQLIKVAGLSEKKTSRAHASDPSSVSHRPPQEPIPKTADPHAKKPGSDSPLRQGRPSYHPAHVPAAGIDSPGVAKSVSKESYRATQATQATQASQASPGQPQVVVFFSCKGGSGATTLGINTAHHYARASWATCVVDLDLQLGDALAALALQPRLTLARALGAIVHGDGINPAALAQHGSGLSVLSQVGSVEDLDKISAESVTHLMGGLGQRFTKVVIDGVRDFSDHVLAILDTADTIALVTLQEVLAIRRARWVLSILRKIGFAAKDITLVVNRFDPASDISLPTIQRIFPTLNVRMVPNEPHLVLQSLNRGLPLHAMYPRHSLTQHVERLAAALAGETSEGHANPLIKAGGKAGGNAGGNAGVAWWRRWWQRWIPGEIPGGRHP